MATTTDNNVIFYVLFPNDTEEDCIKESNQLGTIEQKKKYIDKKFTYHNEFLFYPNKGFDILKQIIQKFPQKLELLRIINSKGKTYTIEKFLGVLENCTIK